MCMVWWKNVIIISALIVTFIMADTWQKSNWNYTCHYVNTLMPESQALPCLVFEWKHFCPPLGHHLDDFSFIAQPGKVLGLWKTVVVRENIYSDRQCKCQIFLNLPTIPCTLVIFRLANDTIANISQLEAMSHAPLTLMALQPTCEDCVIV